MAKIELGYGRSSLTFEYDDARFAVLAPNETESHPLSDNEVSAAFDDPVDSPPLEELIALRRYSSDRRVGRDARHRQCANHQSPGSAANPKRSSTRRHRNHFRDRNSSGCPA